MPTPQNFFWILYVVGILLLGVGVWRDVPGRASYGFRWSVEGETPRDAVQSAIEALWSAEGVPVSYGQVRVYW